jgi:hypothetical protein
MSHQQSPEVESAGVQWSPPEYVGQCKVLVTPIKDPALIKKIALQALDLPITMTTRELFSVSPDIRKHIKEQLITKRVSTSALMGSVDPEDPRPTYLSKISEENLVVANHVKELRVIDVLIHGVDVVATVNDGSQILSIRQDVWEKLGLPIRSDKIMVMEFAGPQNSNRKIRLLCSSTSG